MTAATLQPVPPAFAQALREESARWPKLLAETGAKID